ncbi:hypothetical protein ACHAW5_001433 [Stephanodiscus triporus]|uniref:DNA repair protein REV1 n=1 Tax=Stephanodiscus triporus TaxID=2934178 RepID=A0ABD3MVU8_9STRA
MAKRAMNSGGRTSRSNFNSVPADDGFRNYMARKIELQRKQFGLVVPPPPTTKSFGNSDVPTATITDANSTKNRKSVRFHDNLVLERVSHVLNNLKRKHTGEKSSRFSAETGQRKLRGPTGSDRESSTDNDAPETLSADEADNKSDNQYASILGVLDNLQKRHGTSCLKKKRSYTADESSKRPRISQSVGVKTSSVLDLVEYDDRAGFSSYLAYGNSGAGSGTPLSKRKTESPTCKGRSLLEVLEPTRYDSTSQEDEPIAYDCLGQRYPEDHFHKSSMSPKLGLSQLTQHSPASSAESVTHLSPIIRAEAPPIKLTRKPNQRPDLFFMGVIVLVNGYTSPDATTLMRLLHKHGGDLEKYETQRVTHIIAEQLSAAKANIYKHQKKPTPVCRPEWITESVKCGRLLPFGDYLLENVQDRDVVGTKSVKSFFRPNPDRTDELPADEQLGDKITPPEKGSNGFSIDEPKSQHRWEDKPPSEANYHINGQVRTVGNDPNFLESYFSNSRLSYIGSFKQRVKPTKQAACHSQSIIGARKFVLLVDMDCFFASVALRRYPQYRDKPVAVGHSHVARTNLYENTTKTRNKNSSSELSTCNYIARKHGIRKGMFLGDAIEICPDLVVLPYDFDGYEEVSGVVADLLHGYAEHYNGYVEQVSCDESYVEINIKTSDTGSDIYAFVNSVAEKIRTDIVRNTACTASIGIGPNKLLAKLAADTVKPNACCVVRDWREFLHSRSLRDIPGIGRKLETKLQSHGLCTVDDIWDLEQDAVSVVGGIIGTGNADKIVRFCYGKDDRPVTPAIRKSIGAECNYGVRFNGPYGVDYMMQGLAKEVHSRMVVAAVRGSKIVLKVMKSKDPSKVPGKFLGHGHCDSFSRSAEMSLTRDKEVIFLAAMKLYEKLVVNDSSVRGIGILITSLKSDDEVSALNSSPSKLSEWLQKDKSTTVCDGHESRELHETLKQDLFSLPENDQCGTSGFATMPSFSQLDQDVLSNLPENILMEVRATYGHKSSSQTSSNTSLLNPSKSRSPGKSFQNDKPIPIVGQASVRRMLKLACVKSGDEQLGSNDLSLSQLDRLPLELQLQLANQDEVKIMKKSKHKINRIIKSDQNDTNDVEFLAVGGLQVKGSPENQCTNFHQDNVLPLQDFISSNPDPDSGAIDKVRDFLSLCVHERKLDDAVIFLRTIKNMSNGWADNIYSWLRKSTMDEINSRTGDVLDIKWLGL